MRCWDTLTLCGHVIRFDFGRTNQGADACFVDVEIRKKASCTTARINVYENFKVDLCRRALSVGSGVVVRGELMSRTKSSWKDRVLEVRCLDLQILGGTNGSGERSGTG